MVSSMNLLLLAAETASDDISWPMAFTIVSPMIFIGFVLWLMFRR